MLIVRTLSALAVLASFAAAAQAQKTHEIRLEADREKESYQFSPARVTAAPGDVLLFKVVNGAPHSIVFEAKDLSPTARSALNSALSRRSADLSSPLLTKDGTEYRLILPRLPPGTYAYFCLPHRAYDMRGEIVVKK